MLATKQNLCVHDDGDVKVSPSSCTHLYVRKNDSFNCLYFTPKKSSEKPPG